MNNRQLARLLLLRMATREALMLLLTVVAVALAAVASLKSPTVQADPVAVRLLKSIPGLIFGVLVVACPVLVVRLIASDRASGWTAAVFAARGSAVTYIVMLVAGVTGSAAAVHAGASSAFHLGAGDFSMDVTARTATGILGLGALSMYAALLSVLLYDPARTTLAMLVLWLGPLGLAFWLVVMKGLPEPPTWLRVLLAMVPPVRQSQHLTTALFQGAYVALVSSLVVALAPRRLPVWR